MVQRPQPGVSSLASSTFTMGPSGNVLLLGHREKDLKAWTSCMYRNEKQLGGQQAEGMVQTSRGEECFPEADFSRKSFLSRVSK